MQVPEPLTVGDFESASQLLAEAFFDNPAHVYLFPDERQRADRLAWILRRNLEAQAPLKHSFCVAEQSTARPIVAMGFWHAPEEPSVGPRGLLRWSFLAIPFRCGLTASRRLAEIARRLEEERRAALGGMPAWYLNNMAVSKRLRGSGVGSALLGRELRDRVDPTGHPAVLATQRPENVVFYRRLGFEVAADARIGSGSAAFRNWTMVRTASS